MNKTKRYTIITISICFIFILGIGIFQSFHKTPVQENTTDIKEQTDIEDEEESPLLEETPTQSSTEQKPKETNQESKNNNIIENKQPSKQQESNPPQDIQDNTEVETNTEETIVSETQTITIHITIEGINELLADKSIELEDNVTAYSALKNVCKQQNIRITTSGYGSMVYVKGIGDLKEREHGSSSGWMYKVNDISPNVGAGSYQLKDGDHVVWYYVYE